MQTPSWLQLGRVSARELTTLLHLGVDLVRPTARSTRAVGEAKLPAVLLVHGFLARAPTMAPLARTLLSAGARDVVLVDYPSTELTLEQIVDVIAAAAEPLVRAHGRIAVVGHSLGAFAVRTWIKRYGGASSVSVFVSLGGPHAGTALWPLLSPSLRAVLRPGSPEILALAATPEPVRTVVLRARYDHQVFPPVRANIGGIEEIVVQGHGHNGLLLSPEVHAATVHAIAASLPPAQVRGDPGATSS